MLRITSIYTKVDDTTINMIHINCPYSTKEIQRYTFLLLLCIADKQHSKGLRYRNNFKILLFLEI